MEIQHQSDESKGKFFVEREGSVAAELTYSKAGENRIIIDHTEVAPALRGENIGRALVDRAVEFAREKELEVVPVCPYVKSVMERDESLQDVLKKE